MEFETGRHLYSLRPSKLWILTMLFMVRLMIWPLVASTAKPLTGEPKSVQLVKGSRLSSLPLWETDATGTVAVVATLSVRPGTAAG